MSSHFDSDEDLGINRFVFENSLDAILLTKPDGSILAANPTAEKMFDLTEEEIKTVGRDGLLVQDENLKSVIEERAQKGRVRAELTFIRKDGTTFPGEVTSTIFKDANGNDRTNMTIRDLSDHKSAEKKLVEAEKRYHLVADFTYDWEEWYDKKRKLQYVSPSCERITGYNAQEFLADPHLIFSIIHPDDQEIFKKHFNVDFFKAQPLTITFRIITGDERICWIEHICQPVYGDDGKFMGRRASNRDITERKQIEEKLREREANFRSVFENSLDVIYRFNLQKGNYEYMSPATRTFGFEPEELMAMSDDEVISRVHPDDRPTLLSILSQINQTGKGVAEYRFQGKDDAYSWWSNQIVVIKDSEGKPLYRDGFVRDITERKQAEIELEETLNNLEELVEERTKELVLANDYNRNLIETALDPLVTIGPDGKITDVNRATETVTGYSREELVDTKFSDYFTNPEKAEESYQLVFRDGMVRDYPLEIKHKNGDLTPVLYNASVYKNEFGEVIGVFAAARDITERKKAEEEIQSYWESLEEQVQLRTEELEKSNADLKQFAYVASHDLREPLRMITSFLQLLERRYKDQLDEDANEFIGFAVDGAKRLDKMIMDLLEYSRVANQKVVFEDVGIGEVVDQVKLNLNVLINENNAKLTHDLLPNINVDENQMVILLQNLISNAIKYRREETPRIHISSQKDEDQHIFSVKDNGIGIDPQNLGNIFTIFKRLHTHEEYEGTGIGLAIAQRIVHQHDGEIWVESEPGNGSAFYFTIPKLKNTKN